MARKRHTGRARRPAVRPTSRPAIESGTGRKAAKHPADWSVVGVGASAGGLEAFSAVLESLPADTGMAFVFISHLDPKHESILTALLARKTAMPVLEAKHRMALEPNHVYVIPRNARMVIDNRVLSLSRRLAPPGENLPIDHFMESLARDRKHRAIGVILSGTASDGTLGLTAIKNVGGMTLVQDPSTAKYDGMPKSAIRAKVADLVLPPRQIAAMLAQFGRTHGSIAAAASLKTGEPSKGEGLEVVFVLLRQRTGTDFSTYKEATVRRRLRHRMVLRKIPNLADYTRVLRREPAEVDALCEDLLIKVTEFFRDPKTFERLGTAILPSLLKTGSPKEPFRVWVPGCASGEEAYSIAMLLLEVTARLRLHKPIQVFATDLSDTAIAAARKGIYPGSIADSVSSARRRLFFMKSGQQYKVSQRVREICVFARQDLTKDPPFSKVDFLSCRNVLIYMGRSLQDTVLPMFHYALKPGGCLLLGKSETIDNYANLFTPVDRNYRIYRKKPVPATQMIDLPALPAGPAAAVSTRAVAAAKPEARTVVSVREEANRLILDKYAPSGVVINGKLEILEILGDPHSYMRLKSGTANLSLLRLVRHDLVGKLSAAVDLARRTGDPVRKEWRPVRGDHGGASGPSFEIIPMAARPEQDPCLLVLFESASPSSDAHDKGPAAGGKNKAGAKGNGRELIRLKHELADSQQHLRLLMDDRQTAEEELKSANEELMSSMEELQSANEELQTSHEELESTNEELTTVNDQLAVRNRDLMEIGNDLTNLVTSVNVPILILTRDLRLRRSTIAADKVMGLAPADIGRPIREIRHNLKLPDLEAVAAGVLKSLKIEELEVQDHLNVWYSMRVRPYRTEDDRIDGLVVVLLEIDRLKRLFQEVERSRNFSRTIVEAVQEPLLVLGGDRRVLMANLAFLRTFHLSHAAIENRLVFDLKPSGFQSAAFKSLLEDTLAAPTRLDFEIEFQIGAAPPMIMSIDARHFDLLEGHGQVTLLTMKDITRFRLTEQRLVAAQAVVQKGRLQAESSLRETKHDLRSSRSELRILAGRLIRAQEDERKRIARELHDDLSQRLSALQLGSASLARRAPANSSDAADHLEHQEHLAAIVEEVRRLAYDLHPAILTHLGLRAALQSFCVEFSAREGIDVDLSAHKEPASLSEEVALCLYRVTQEALRNVARHSGAASVIVTLKPSNGGLRLSIVDRGKGFHARAGLPGEGLGFLSMNERVMLVRGTFHVKSKVGQGTQIEVWVPLPPPKPR